MEDFSTSLDTTEWVDYEEYVSRLLDPTPTDDIGDLAAWCAAYRARLARTVIPHRNRVRDSRLLEVMCSMMLEQKSRAFLAPLRPLSERANFDKKTVLSALESLRAAGYLLRVEKDAETKAWRYCLVAEKLAELGDGEAATPIKTNIQAMVIGDYRDDAYNHKALGKSQVAVYKFLLDNEGKTIYGISKATGLDCKTVRSAVEKLVVERMVRMVDKIVEVRKDVVRTDRQVSDIAVKHHTVGKTRERMEMFDVDRLAYAYFRKTKCKLADHYKTPTEDLEME